ncbi:MAG: nitroreductase [Proteobacteria bacterium]|nr:MAG: nitroreductase [Pseudomonadota bacterium]
MWDFFETVRHRHSVRKYHSDMPVEEEKLHAILEMACAAPTAGDLQSYRIVVVRDPDARDALCKATKEQDFLCQAPVSLVFCADTQRAAEEYGERGRNLYSIQDATISAAYAQLAIVAAGLGTAWVGYFDEEQVSKVLDLQAGEKPIAIICVGYPAELPEPTPRRPLDQITRTI